MDKQERIRKFLMDEATSEAVYDFLLKAFLDNKQPGDVHVLAASRMAIDLLQTAWKRLENLKDKIGNEEKVRFPTHV